MGAADRGIPPSDRENPVRLQLWTIEGPTAGQFCLNRDSISSGLSSVMRSVRKTICIVYLNGVLMMRFDAIMSHVHSVSSRPQIMNPNEEAQHNCANGYSISTTLRTTDPGVFKPRWKQCHPYSRSDNQKREWVVPPRVFDMSMRQAKARSRHPTPGTRNICRNKKHARNRNNLCQGHTRHCDEDARRTQPN